MKLNIGRYHRFLYKADFKGTFATFCKLMEMSNGVWFYLFIVCKDKLFINALACRMITFVTFETNEDSQNSRDIEMLSFSRQSFPQFKVSV